MDVEQVIHLQNPVVIQQTVRKSSCISNCTERQAQSEAVSNLDRNEIIWNKTATGSIDTGGR